MKIDYTKLLNNVNSMIETLNMSKFEGLEVHLASLKELKEIYELKIKEESGARLIEALQADSDKYKKDLAATQLGFIPGKPMNRSKKVDVPTEQWQKSVERRLEALEEAGNLDMTLVELDVVKGTYTDHLGNKFVDGKHVGKEY